MRKLLKVLRWIGWGVLGLVVVAVIAWGVFYLQAWFSLRREVNLLHRQGISTRIADYVPAKVTASENAAWPYRKAFPVVQAVSYQAQVEVGRWSEAVTVGPSMLTRSDWAQLQKWLAAVGGALPLVKEAVRRPHCEFPVQWEKGFDAVFPDIARMRECARLLTFEAMLREKKGDRGALVRVAGDLFRMGEQIGADPSLINQLVCYVIDSIGLRALEHGLMHSSVSVSEAKAVFDQLARIDLRPEFMRALETERPSVMQWFDQARAGKRSQREWLGNYPMTVSTDSGG